MKKTNAHPDAYHGPNNGHGMVNALHTAMNSAVNKRRLIRQTDRITTPARYDGVTRSPRTIMNIKKGKKS